MTVATTASPADISAALAGLHAAGDDLEALTEALERAAFLDGIPGEDRQKLRAARAKLRKLSKEAAASGAANGPAREYDPSEFSPLVERYEKLNWRMVSKPGGTTVKPDDFYRLYALHMQATQGDNASERPMWADKGNIDFEGRARWDAWSALKGLDQAKARLRFVKLYHEFSGDQLYKDTRQAAV